MTRETERCVFCFLAQSITCKALRLFAVTSCRVVQLTGVVIVQEATREDCGDDDVAQTDDRQTPTERRVLCFQEQVTNLQSCRCWPSQLVVFYNS
mmetsp:Transcript_14602/g.23770  ORF Transcript_14602/g.23770 Transcript_14602/m.23770 type:complete len:95 (-) Transcript_14602:112-396(-)